MSGLLSTGISEQRVTTGDPVKFGPSELRTPTRTRSLERTTPTLFDKAFAGRGKERRRLKTRAFEDIDLSAKSAFGNLRETFGRSGVRGGVQGADVSDIIESIIGAKGAASTGIEDILKQNEQQDISNLLGLLTSPEPFAIGQKTRSDNPFAQSAGGTFGKTVRKPGR